eukprot:m.241176 g.241176  ORF g.241176 m.241176 type:complete len:503 (+) comp26302_c0_seq1:214-1722(+)
MESPVPAISDDRADGDCIQSIAGPGTVASSPGDHHVDSAFRAVGGEPPAVTATALIESEPAAAANPSRSGSAESIVTSTPTKTPQRRGHTRQRSLSCSDTLVLEQQAQADTPSTPDKPPLFVGRAPSEGRASAGHSYTPAKPVLPKPDLAATTLTADTAASAAGDLITTRRPLIEAKAVSDSDLKDPPNKFRETETLMKERAEVSAIFSQFTCYDMISDSGKIVVLDTKLKVKKAFAALIHHKIRAAVLWDSSSQQYIGMITVSDFINILRKYYVSPLVKIDELEDHQIQTWRDITAVDKSRPSTLVCIDPNASLYDAVLTLRSTRVHRLPVIDNRTGNALYIATLAKILKYARQAVPWEKCPTLMAATIKDLGIGTLKNVAAVSEDTPLISVLNIFSERRISALPVIDSEGTVLDIYVKTDAIMLARDRTYNNLDVSVSAALTARHVRRFDEVQTCLLSDALGDILDRMVNKDLHRLIIVDQHKRLLGVISLSDILTLFIM